MILTVVPGIALVLIILIDVFQTLFIPEEQGSSSHRVLVRLWRLLARISNRGDFVSSRLGGYFFVLVLLSWLVLMILGWALIYWPFLDPELFLFSTGLHPLSQQSFLDSLYFSAVTLTTLGFGDVTPRNDLLRILTPIQATLGFALLTAGLSWLLSLYPNLAAQRALAQRIRILTRQHQGRGLLNSGFSKTSVESTYSTLAQQIVAVQTSLLQFPILFFFRTTDPYADISWALDQLPGLIAAELRASPPAPVLAELKGLSIALDLFAQTITQAYLGVEEGATEEILKRFNRHLNADKDDA